MSETIPYTTIGCTNSTPSKTGVYEGVNMSTTFDSRLREG